MKYKGLRYNTGKLRYDLVHPEAHEGMVKVLTFGSTKYKDRNWENGMAWSNVIASMKRHIAAFERGEDYDYDPNCEDCKDQTKQCQNHSGELHVDHMQCNAHFLSAYYRMFPQGDDRPHRYLNVPKIGLDIDEVLCDWVGGWVEKFDLDVPKMWFFDRDIISKFEDLKSKGEIEDFYLSLKPLISPDSVPFEPHCYVTSRPVDTEVSEKWLDQNGFPARPVHSIGVNKSKVEVLREAGVEIFVDDRWENFVEINQAGICCFLMNAPHNERYNAGYKRIYNLSQILPGKT